MGTENKHDFDKEINTFFNQNGNKKKVAIRIVSSKLKNEIEENQSTSKELIEEIIYNYKKIDKLLSDKLERAFDVIENREELKIEMKKYFFYRIMSLLVILVCSPIFILLIFHDNTNSYTFIVSIIASIVELTTGIIVLPKIIAQYLFDKEEDNLYFTLIENLKTYHANKEKYINKK